MSVRNMLRQVAKLETTARVASAKPKKIVFVSPSEYDRVNDDTQTLYIEDVNLDKYDNLPALNRADETRFLKQLGF